MPTVPNTNSSSVRYQELLASIGRAGLHALFPKDFEAYFISLELTDSRGRVVDFFSFPVAPEQVSETQSKITNIKKTAGGITAISSDTFVPTQIQIQGTFGRRLRFVIGQTSIDAVALAFSTQGGKFNKEALFQNGLSVAFPNFSIQVKTGYGAIKILEAIISKSDSLDADGNPYRLFFYNSILGNNYLVKVNTFIHSQTQDQNMIPRYNLQMTSIAPLEYVRDNPAKSLLKSTAFGALNKTVDTVAKSIKSVI